MSVGKISGAVGNAAHLGVEVEEAICRRLDLEPAPVASQVIQRDRHAYYLATLAVIASTLDKIATEIRHLQRTEVREAEEFFSEKQKGSSAMPHKRNPVACAAVLSAAIRVPGLVGTMLAAMPQEHERGLGGWHAEWETLPEIVSLAGGAVHTMTEITPRLEVDADRMRQNLDATRGLIFAEAFSMALAQKIGKAKAHELIEAASDSSRKDGKHLREVISADANISQNFSAADIDELFDASKYLGMAEQYVDGVVSASAEDKNGLG